MRQVVGVSTVQLEKKCTSTPKKLLKNLAGPKSSRNFALHSRKCMNIHFKLNYKKLFIMATLRFEEVYDINASSVRELRHKVHVYIDTTDAFIVLCDYTSRSKNLHHIGEVELNKRGTPTVSELKKVITAYRKTLIRKAAVLRRWSRKLFDPVELERIEATEEFQAEWRKHLKRIGGRNNIAC